LIAGSSIFDAIISGNIREFVLVFDNRVLFSAVKPGGARRGRGANRRQGAPIRPTFFISALIARCLESSALITFISSDHIGTEYNPDPMNPALKILVENPSKLVKIIFGSV